VGLVLDNKLLELLDLALSADTANTVRCMRELLDLGADALSLVTQLASLITNILAGTFDIHQTMHKKGFFKRNFCMPWPIVFVLCMVCFLFWEE
jgi:DNA polymerase III gamma/tau subunit